MKHTAKILFICKQRPAQYGASYGLLNSCRFLCNALQRMGFEARLVEVIDNNGIDREVHIYKPTHVFIEALWVVPEKFDVLIPLHPNVQWYVRLHSNTPFLSNEGIAIEWIRRYGELQKKYSQFHVSPNSIKMCYDLRNTFNLIGVYSPNIYEPSTHIKLTSNLTKSIVDKLKNGWRKKKSSSSSNIISIACMGAVRPMKNQLIQAMAAIVFADQIGKTLHFHINSTRIEQKGDNIYKNLKALFSNTNHKLIEHEWLSHEEFQKLVLKMDIGMQISFSETFNIVAADFAYLNIPIVGSEEIPWLNSFYCANPTDLNDIVDHLWFAWIGKRVNLQKINKWNLERWNWNAKHIWRDHIISTITNCIPTIK